MLITEHEFELPKGYIDKAGVLHRTGAMRLATAADEILPMKDPRVQNLPAYLIVILLSRVIVRLGTLPQINPGIIEGIFSEDLAFLQDMYNTINGLDNRQDAIRCKNCGEYVELEEARLGGSQATPWNGSTRR
jgi:hypothetical protein